MTTTDKQPVVFVVDDDADLRDSLEALIGALGFATASFASGAQFRQFYKPHMAGCLLLDVYMPRQNGLELYAQLLHEGKKIPVIFMTAHADISTAVAAMKTGAIEFLEKPFDPAMLKERLAKAISLDTQWRDSDARLAAVEGKIASLTQRERETLQMIIDGLSNKVMASKLDLTERAVEMRRSRIMTKLSVRSVAELLNVAVTYRVMNELRNLRQWQPLE